MEAKKLIPILVLTTCLSSLGACTQNNQKVSFGGYWQANSLITENLHEKLLYDVEYNDDNAAMYDYTINYTNGQYVTELQSATENGKNILIYKTELTINVTYTHKGTTSEVFEDKVVTEAKFYTADNSLRPISSFKELVSTSPANNGSTLESCYHKFHYEASVTYNENCTGGTATVTENPDGETPTTKTAEFTFDKDKYSRLDNETLLFAIRAIPSTTNSAKIQTYSPFVEREQIVALSFSAETAAEFTYTENGESKTRNISYRPVNIVLDENNPGATQKAWYAKVADTTKNTYRNVMLRLETPISYGLGTLVYKLKSVDILSK